ncbi:M81 family metallopeptidase [Paraburkholderia sp. Ac-20347]|uniref:M81 family metallopeptidase n=1 Tax=Paraburkholderia sp. Ac-20347 TaxID=2703892 RepID=UPI0019806EB0|nr:M81 family metallopeptidase [Paraburkholderia sp. Ac-20347]MBN3811458.1 M81 family metallopeptidase [Paraburkholderia sp. Ac-20347]
MEVKLKVFACGISHESHSFSKRYTTMEDFCGAEVGYVSSNPHLVSSRSTEGGILVAAREKSWELIFPFCARATPKGPLTSETFERLSGQLIDELRKAGHVDGVLLALHGAMFSEAYPDCEGEILERVRGVVGQTVPIALALDLHTNFTDRMARLADITTSFRTTPHIDQWETTYRAAGLLDDAMHGRTRPKVYVSRLPMLAGFDMGRTVGSGGPMNELLGKAREIEAMDDDVLDVALNAGYYYGDVFEAGPSVTVTGNGDDDRFQAVADSLMRAGWESRDYVSIEHVSVTDAVEHAQCAPRGSGPLILVDYTDGPAGGADGDGTRLLSALLEANLADTVVGPIFDPQAASLAVSAGVGKQIELEVGGRGDQTYSGAPVRVSGVVRSISDGNYVRKGPYSTGTVGSLGESALIQDNNVSVLVVSKRMQPEDQEQYRIFGIEPKKINILACKGINHFRADFEPIARELVFVDTGGLVAVDFKKFPFKNVRRPIWPLDPDVTI